MCLQGCNSHTESGRHCYQTFLNTIVHGYCCLAPQPTFLSPQLCLCVASIFNKLEKLTVGHRILGSFKLGNTAYTHTHTCADASAYNMRCECTKGVTNDLRTSFYSNRIHCPSHKRGSPLACQTLPHQLAL